MAGDTARGPVFAAEARTTCQQKLKRWFDVTADKMGVPMLGLGNLVLAAVFWFILFMLLSLGGIPNNVAAVVAGVIAVGVLAVVFYVEEVVPAMETMRRARLYGWSDPDVRRSAVWGGALLVVLLVLFVLPHQVRLAALFLLAVALWILRRYSPRP